MKAARKWCPSRASSTRICGVKVKDRDDQRESGSADQAPVVSDLSNVLSLVPIPYLIVDEDHRLRRLTPEAGKLCHLYSEDVGQTVSQLPFETGSSDLGELALRVSERAETVQQEIRAKDGRWYSMRVGPYRAAEGTIDGVLVAFVDIDELKQSHDQARSETEATVRALLETAAQAILAVDGDGHVVLVNAAAETMFGYSRAELLDLALENLIPKRLRERHAQYHADWRLQPQNRPMGVGRDLVALRKDGSEFPVEVSLSHIRTNGDMLGVAFLSDITDRKKSESALLEYQRDLQELSSRLLSVQEAETKLLARELHDVFSQKLAGLGMQISALLKSSSKPHGVPLAKLKALGQEVSELAEDIHRMSRQLHPAILDDLGLEAALREECDSFSQQTGIPVEFQAEGISRSLPEDIALCLYRVAQESLRNIAKHAQATEVRVLLTSDRESVNLLIEDVGDGFDVEEVRGKGGLGMISMEERARLVNGTLSIRSQLGVGTRVELTVSLGQKAS